MVQTLETTSHPQKKQESSVARIIRTDTVVTNTTTTVTFGDDEDHGTSKQQQQPGDDRNTKRNMRISGDGPVAVPVVEAVVIDPVRGQGENGDDCQKPTPAKRARVSPSTTTFLCQDEDNVFAASAAVTAASFASAAASASRSSSSSKDNGENFGGGGKKKKNKKGISEISKSESEWRVVLLVDDREPRPFLEKLKNTLHSSRIDCERRRLATFDYLWVATRRRKKKNNNGDHDDDSSHQQQQGKGNDDYDDDDLVLDHGVERKEIHDLASGLNLANKTTGLTRSVEQHLKMDQSGVRHKHFVVQGRIASLYRHPFRFNAIMKKRITKHISNLELPDSGYQVHRFSDARHNDETVDFLQRLHYQVQAQFQMHQQQNQHYSHYKLTFRQFTARAAWVTQVASARKVLPKCALGEKKLAVVLQEFLNEEAFRKAYDGHDGCGDEIAGGGGKAAMIERLISLQTNNDDGNINRSSAGTSTTTKRRHVFSRSNAEALCAHLVSVTTTTVKRTTPAETGAAATGSSRTRTAAPTRDTPTKATCAATTLAMVTPERDLKATDKPAGDGTTAKTALFVD